MEESHKTARQYLKQCTRKEFEKIVQESYLSELEGKMLFMHIIKDNPLGYIGDMIGLSERAVKIRLRKIYGKVAKVL